MTPPESSHQPDDPASTATHADAVKQSFGGPEAAKIVDISYRQLDHWARKGLVTPSVASATGSGSQRRYSYEDLLELKVIKGLRDAGLSLQRIAKAFTYIREHLNESAAGLRILSDGNRVYACRSNDEVIDLLDRGQVVFGFAVGKVVDDLDGSIASIGMLADAGDTDSGTDTTSSPDAARAQSS